MSPSNTKSITMLPPPLSRALCSTPAKEYQFLMQFAEYALIPPDIAERYIDQLKVSPIQSFPELKHWLSVFEKCTDPLIAVKLLERLRRTDRNMRQRLESIGGAEAFVRVIDLSLDDDEEDFGITNKWIQLMLEWMLDWDTDALLKAEVDSLADDFLKLSKSRYLLDVCHRLNEKMGIKPGVWRPWMAQDMDGAVTPKQDEGEGDKTPPPSKVDHTKTQKRQREDTEESEDSHTTKLQKTEPGETGKSGLSSFLHKFTQSIRLDMLSPTKQQETPKRDFDPREKQVLLRNFGQARDLIKRKIAGRAA